MVEVALGIDVGTGSTKAGLVDLEGGLLAVGRAANVVTEPRPGWSESDPRCWLEAARSAVGAALAERPDASVVAIGLSGQMHGVVLCDSALEPIRPAVLWSDRRSQPLLAPLRARFDERELGRLANPIVAGMAGPTVAALRRIEPGTFDRVVWALQVKDWLRGCLTGAAATDPSDASATLLWDMTEDDWSPAACEVFEVERSWLPPVARSAALGGSLTSPAATRFGLTAGLPVAVGAADTAAALLGAGIAPGQTQVSTGTGGQIATLVGGLPDGGPRIDPTHRTHLFRAATGGLWYAMAAMQNVGIAVDWALGLLEVDLEEAAAAVARTEPGSSGVTFLPYLTGERTPHLDAELTGGWNGLRSGTDRADLIRSVFEGVAFALRDGLDALTEAGHLVDRALVAGGGSTAPWWRQMLADVLGIPLVPHDASDASVRGAGLLALTCLGVTVDPAAAVGHGSPVEPHPRRVQTYDEVLERFRATAAAASSSRIP